MPNTHVRGELVRIGDSLALSLPVEVVKELKLQEGEEVEVSVNPSTGAIAIQPGIKYFEDGKVTPRFRAMAEKILKERDELFRRLSKS